MTTDTEESKSSTTSVNVLEYSDDHGNGASTSSQSEPASVFLVTSPDTDTSRKIAHGLLTKKLAACVNLVPKISSLYWWDGKIQEDTEELMIIKSTNALTNELEKEIKALHPYDTPEFIRLPITAGSPEYLDWIAKSVASSKVT